MVILIGISQNQIRFQGHIHKRQNGNHENAFILRRKMVVKLDGDNAVKSESVKGFATLP